MCSTCCAGVALAFPGPPNSSTAARLRLFRRRRSEAWSSALRWNTTRRPRFPLDPNYDRWVSLASSASRLSPSPIPRFSVSRLPSALNSRLHHQICNLQSAIVLLPSTYWFLSAAFRSPSPCLPVPLTPHVSRCHSTFPIPHSAFGLLSAYRQPRTSNIAPCTLAHRSSLLHPFRIPNSAFRISIDSAFRIGHEPSATVRCVR